MTFLALTIEGDRAAPANNDTVRAAFLLSNDGGVQTECAGIEARMTNVASGATELRFLSHSGAVLAARMRMTNANLAPLSNDSLALGASSLAWADLFLASGGVINFNNGDVTITHSPNALAVAGGRVTLESLSMTLGNYADDSAAASGGVPVGGFYRNGSVVMIRAA